MPEQKRGPIARLSGALMLGGSLLLLATALLTTASVLRRWLLDQPIPGDFELVQMGAGIAVFGFLAHGTLAGSHILVDSFTTWLPQRVQAAIDAFWNLVWGLVALALAWRMALGTLESLASDTRSMVLSVPIWPGIGLGALAFLATALAAGLAARRLLQGRPA
ncbi:TRAP transporter small permease protein [Pseudoroseomonas deserti]|uniref:TRAP transporter small permease protein n=1 Tax=Teichococcus deserti TaxID=1817963 RepID=A0A1V2H3M8_9PROT|nr:TRAP transporter small permease [Pseudoroseomonas deserti]ONG55490.1 TRAP transporter small permease protein [Pseudoroseomonas deserti]